MPVSAFTAEVEQPIAAGASALDQSSVGFLTLKPVELASLAGLDARRRPAWR